MFDGRGSSGFTIQLGYGRPLITLRNAGAYIPPNFPKADQQLGEWHTAIEALLVVVKQTGQRWRAKKFGLCEIMTFIWTS